MGKEWHTHTGQRKETMFAAAVSVLLGEFLLGTGVFMGCITGKGRFLSVRFSSSFGRSKQASRP
jgi:hypothetical protein